MNNNQNDDVKRVLDSVDVVELVSEYIELQRRGKNYFGLCPFHDENTPSFSVSPEKKLAMCMGCGEGGNTITFYSKIKNITFREALIELADRAGIKIAAGKVVKDPNEDLYQLLDEVSQYYTNYLYFSETGQKAIGYLEKRKINKTLIKKYRLGFAPEKIDSLYQYMKEKKYSTTDLLDLGLVRQNDQGKYYDYFTNRLIFPITNAKGQTVGFSARSISSREQVKYLNSPESKVFHKGELLYNLSEASSEIRKNKKIYLTEGFFDVIKADQNGLPNVVATMGTALTQSQVSLLARFTSEVIIAFDGDEAGMKANLSALKSILTNNKLKVNVLSLPNKMDLDDFFNKNSSEKGLQIINERQMDGINFAYKYLSHNKDLTNSGDLSKFKNEFETIISTQSQAVFSLYEKQFSEDYGFAISFNRVKTNNYSYQRPNQVNQTNQTDQYNYNYQHEENRPIPAPPGEVVDVGQQDVMNVRFTNQIKKIEQAQRELIIDLVLQREYYELIKDRLDFSNIHNDIHAKILKAIFDYYNQISEHEFIDLDLFIQLNNDLKDPIEIEVKNRVHWKSNIKAPSRETIINLLHIVDHSDLIYEAFDLFNKISKEEFAEAVLDEDLTLFVKILEKINEFENNIDSINDSNN